MRVALRIADQKSGSHEVKSGTGCNRSGDWKISRDSERIGMVMTISNFPTEADLRNPSRADLHHHISGLDKAFGGRLQVRIGRHGLFDQVV